MIRTTLTAILALSSVGTQDLAGQSTQREAALLPAVLALLQGAGSDDDQLLAGALRFDVFPVLEAALVDVSPAALVEDTPSPLRLVCLGCASGARRGACQSLDNRFATVERHIDRRQTRPALNEMQAIADRFDQDFDRGVFTCDEHVLLAGGVRAILAKLSG